MSNFKLKTLVFFGMVFLLEQALFAAVYRPGGSTAAGGNVANLNTAVSAAVASPEDDIIDLGGYIYIYSAPAGSGYALPDITGGGRLSIINGGIRRSFSAVGTGFGIIHNNGDLELFQVTLENGSVNGGIFNDALGILSLTDCEISYNANNIGGGGIRNQGLIDTIVNTSFSGNSGTIFGGGIYNQSIINNIINSTFSGNLSTSGGGITVEAGASLGVILNSVFLRNSANQLGGAINNNLLGSIGSIINSTFTQNSSLVSGGAISTSGPIGSITNSTFTGNSAATGGGINNTATINNLLSNIIAGNTAGTGPDINSTGTITNEGYNLLSSSSAPTPTIPNYSNNDILQADAVNYFGPLQDNGGPTFTIALLPGSLAISNGINPYSLEYDQRGLPFYRVCGGGIDSGAFEVQSCQ